MKNGFLMTIVANVVITFAWIFLAIYFGKWWIALFSALFLQSTKTERKHYRVCNKCGRHSPYANSHNDALDKAKAEGWTIVRNGDEFEDTCPICKKVEDNKWLRM